MQTECIDYIVHGAWNMATVLCQQGATGKSSIRTLTWDLATPRLTHVASVTKNKMNNRRPELAPCMYFRPSITFTNCVCHSSACKKQV